ncbi:MAG: hypothetical protein KDA94_06410, partial [Acidimicrobiales bacterium]|nr:hypothetical protein [Acidimicrobiales bacterium]
AGVGILWVLGQAVDAQRTMARSVRPLDALAFWPSAALPALVVLVPAGAIVALLGIDRRRRGIGPVLAPELEVAGALIATVVPVAAVAAMLATSGIYFHRYGQAALVGVAIVVAAAIGPGSGTVAPARRALAGVVVGFLAAGVAMATLHTARSFVSERSARAMVAELGLDGGGSDEVFAIDEYDLLLLRHVAPPAVGSRMGLGALADGSSQAPGVVGSPERVDLVDRLAALEPGASIDLVGSPAELDPFRSGFEGTIVEVGTATFARPGADRELVHLRFTAR